jgi:ABC-type transporter Mla subunit MlaD
MSSTLIQQSLIDIEQNLKKLESASSQVGNMAEKSEQLISSIASVIESIEAIKNSFSNDENYLKNNVQESLEYFGKTLSKAGDSFNNKASVISSKHEKVINDTIVKMNEFKSNLSDVQKTILDFDLEKNLGKISYEISSLSEQITKSQVTAFNDVTELKAQLKNISEKQEKSAKLNLILIAAGFALTILIILIT